MIDKNTDLLAGQDEATKAAGQAKTNGAPAWADDDFVARYTHHGRLRLHATVGLDPDLADVLDGRFVGCSPERLREIRNNHIATVARTADVLLGDPVFAAQLARVTTVTGPRTVVLGDSITADSLGWADLLAACLRLAADRHRILRVTVTNLAVSGITSTEAVSMFELAMRERPTCVLAMVGTNDGSRQGAAADVRTVSATETERNIRALRTLTEIEAGARFVGITPPPINQALWQTAVPEGSYFRATSDDHDATLGAVRAALPDGIDLPARLGDHLTDDFWASDGVHPSLEGQTIILRHIVEALAQLPPAAA